MPVPGQTRSSEIYVKRSDIDCAHCHGFVSQLADSLKAYSAKKTSLTQVCKACGREWKATLALMPRRKRGA